MTTESEEKILAADRNTTAFLKSGETICSVGHFRCGFVLSINRRKEVRVDHGLPQDLLYPERQEKFLRMSYFWTGLRPHILKKYSNTYDIMQHLSKGTKSGQVDSKPRVMIIANKHNIHDSRNGSDIDGTWRDIEATLKFISKHIQGEEEDGVNNGSSGFVGHKELYGDNGIDLDLMNSINFQRVNLNNMEYGFSVVAQHLGEVIDVRAFDSSDFSKVPLLIKRIGL